MDREGMSRSSGSFNLTLNPLLPVLVNLWSLAAIPPGSRICIVSGDRIVCENRSFQGFRRYMSSDSRWKAVRRIEELVSTADALTRADVVMGLSRMRLLMALHAAQNGIEALMTTYTSDVAVCLALRTIYNDCDDLCEYLMRALQPGAGGLMSHHCLRGVAGQVRLLEGPGRTRQPYNANGSSGLNSINSIHSIHVDPTTNLAGPTTADITSKEEPDTMTNAHDNNESRDLLVHCSDMEGMRVYSNMLAMQDAAFRPV